LDNLLATYNLVSTIEFPTRIANGFTSIIDNIYIDKIHTRRSIACPVIKGLSDHDIQLIKLENVFMQKKKKKKANEVKIVRNFNTYSISESYNGLRIDDQRTMASIFNDYFSSIAETIMCTNITENNPFG
jgi:hypothetical protein